MQSLHELKYQPTLQQSNCAVRTMTFRTTWEFESCFAAVGYDVKAVQITPGELRGSFELYGSRALPILSIRTNQALVVEGDRTQKTRLLALSRPTTSSFIAFEVNISTPPTFTASARESKTHIFKCRPVPTPPWRSSKHNASTTSL